jgi:integrase
MAREPGYCLHKPTGQAYVNLGGRVFYLGLHNTPESQEKYAQLKAEWLVSKNAEKFVQSPDGPTIASLCLAYLDHAEVYYGPGTELKNTKLAIQPLSELYAKLPAKNFSPLEYRTVRNWWLAKECQRKAGRVTRQYVNTQMKRVMRIVKWGVAEGMVPSSVHQTLKCVDPLKRGRVSAPEAEPIRPVEMDVVASTVKHLPKVVADMVDLQLLLGCRPGEIVKLTPAMVDRSADVWKITLVDHKTAYRGKERTIYAGPKAQAILAKYLLRGADTPCFSPQEALRQRRQAKHEARVTPLSCGNAPGRRSQVRETKGGPPRPPQDAYTTMSYGRAIHYACDKAFPAPKAIKEDPEKLKLWKASHRWAPNRLRHTRATDVRRQFGLEAASSMLGHSEITVTQVYAEADAERAMTVARSIG